MENYSNQYNSAGNPMSQQQQPESRNLNRRRPQQPNLYNPNQLQYNNPALPNNMNNNSRRQVNSYPGQPQNMQNYNNNQRPMLQGRYQPYNMQNNSNNNNRPGRRGGRNTRRRDEGNNNTRNNPNLNNNYFPNHHHTTSYNNNNFENYNNNTQGINQPQQQPFSPREKPCRTLFVRNVEYTTSEEEIREYFSSFGEIREMFTLVSNRGMVFLSYYDIRAAEAAMRSSQNKYFNGRIVDVHFSFPKENVDTNRNPGREDYQGTLFVTLKEGKVPPPTNEQFYDHFSQFGEVIMVRDFRDHVYQKFVEFFDCRACHAAYDGSIEQAFMGGVFDCKFAWDKSIKQMSNSVHKSVAMTGHKHNNQHPQFNKQQPRYNQPQAAQGGVPIPQNSNNQVLMQQAQQLMQLFENRQQQQPPHSNEDYVTTPPQPDYSNHPQPENSNALAELLDQLAQPLKALNSHQQLPVPQEYEQPSNPTPLANAIEATENNNEKYCAVDTPNTTNYETQQNEQPEQDTEKIEETTETNSNNEEGSGDKITQLLQMLAQAQTNEQDNS